MLFNERILFLHVPKAAGTSVTGFLIDNLAGPVTITEPDDRLGATDRISAGEKLKLAARRLRRRLGRLKRRTLNVIPGSRHENLDEARAVLATMGRKLGDFESILAVIRNPYDLEVSRYHFFRRGHLGVRGLAHERAEELALAGDFAEFAKRAPYHGRLPGRIEDWFEIDGGMPANLRVIRFENLEHELRAFIAPYGPVRALLPRLNATMHPPYRSCLTQEIEEAIWWKYRWPFDRGFYARQRLS